MVGKKGKFISEIIEDIDFAHPTSMALALLERNNLDFFNAVHWFSWLFSSNQFQRFTQPTA
ncbi:MAG: hypothetical protein F6K47_36155 [Symploca sp. SIO2E6]|nr:hypothetical protein [Symploca sp. SIO2E6]